MAASGALAGTSFVRAGAAGILAAAEAACTARDEGAPFETLSDAEAREFEAIAARILPTTDTPGAREAGVIWFIDRSFGSIFQGRLEFARGGLAAFQAAIPAQYPGAHAFSDLDTADQDRYLATQESTGFFQFLRIMTLAGFFGMSSYGGNRDHVGWKLLGLEHEHHGWQPPFGYYDAAWRRDETDDA
ncbi:MAG TPA: gluconate 2-dehydrogenase subunit 3 family protein [Woeseiaceae bacterium]|nr:gluconate 2-dehydrogenase subunit 3 family protein [Woeseiaceae bacterium]